MNEFQVNCVITIYLCLAAFIGNLSSIYSFLTFISHASGLPEGQHVCTAVEQDYWPFACVCMLLVLLAAGRFIVLSFVYKGETLYTWTRWSDDIFCLGSVFSTITGVSVLVVIMFMCSVHTGLSSYETALMSLSSSFFLIFESMSIMSVARNIGTWQRAFKEAKKEKDNKEKDCDDVYESGYGRLESYSKAYTVNFPQI